MWWPAVAGTRRYSDSNIRQHRDLLEILILRKKKKKSEEKKGREDEVKEPKVMIRSVVSPIRFNERLKEKKKIAKNYQIKRRIITKEMIIESLLYSSLYTKRNIFKLCIISNHAQFFQFPHLGLSNIDRVSRASSRLHGYFLWPERKYRVYRETVKWTLLRSNDLEGTCTDRTMSERYNDVEYVIQYTNNGLLIRNKADTANVPKINFLDKLICVLIDCYLSVYFIHR